MNARYIVGIDGKAASERALEWVLRRAQRYPAPLVLVRVTTPPDVDGSRALAQLVERTRKSHPLLDIDAIEVRGTVPAALAAVAESDDLLVIGTHQHAFPRRAVTKCLSWEIASASPCSVVVVPQIDTRMRRGVVVGIDHHESGARLAAFAAREAEQFGGELFVVQSVTPSSGSRRAGLAIEDAVAAARTQAATTRITSTIVHDDPARALLRAAHERALLVIGESTTPAADGPERSVLLDVLASIRVPVLLARGIRDDAAALETAVLATAVHAAARVEAEAVQPA
jgi:nucleotide-binding universal stress UspA family protein